MTLTIKFGMRDRQSGIYASSSGCNINSSATINRYTVQVLEVVSAICTKSGSTPCTIRNHSSRNHLARLERDHAKLDTALDILYSQLIFIR